MSDEDSNSVIPVFGVPRRDLGYIYIVENNNLFKIGRSKDPEDRLKAAKTWLPDMKLHGVKPFWNVTWVERCLHTGFAIWWYDREWFLFDNEGDRELLLEGFAWFSDNNPDKNSVDFIYWFNSEGMAEFVRERDLQGLSLPKFLEQESSSKKHNR